MHLNFEIAPQIFLSLENFFRPNEIGNLLDIFQLANGSQMGKKGTIYISTWTLRTWLELGKWERSVPIMIFDPIEIKF